MDMNGPIAIEPGRCCLCHKNFLSEMEANGELESMSICGDCKLLFLEDNGNPTPQITLSTPESLENILSQEFPDMINLARHMQPHVSDHSRSRQLRRVSSDTESDGFDYAFREADDIFPYSVYGEDSEASVDVDNDVDSDSDSDTDTDSMHGVLNRWNSNDYVTPVGRARLHRSLATNGRNLPADWLREVLTPEDGIGISERNGIDESVTWRNGGEYLDDEMDRGAPPAAAAASFVKNLECEVVDDDVEGLECVICKDSVCVGSVVNRLPCLHVYHPSCIMPWLNVHNTCPLCRYELPTDYQKKPNRTQGFVGQNVGVNSDGDSDSDGGGGGGWWLCLAPLVGVVGVGFMLWLGGAGS